MIILDAADITPTLMTLPWGEELALQLQRRFYVRWEQFCDLALAIATCRHALDDGFLCVVLQEDASHVSIWKALADTVPVTATSVTPRSPQPPAATPQSTYRGRPVAVNSQPPSTTPAAFSYRGRPVEAATHSVAIERPDAIFYRGRAV